MRRILVALLIVSVVALRVVAVAGMSDEITSTTPARNEDGIKEAKKLISDMIYVVDPRTNLCFGVSRRGWGPIVILVPCSPRILGLQNK
jgi:hypothetical protein